MAVAIVAVSSTGAHAALGTWDLATDWVTPGTTGSGTSTGIGPNGAWAFGLDDAGTERLYDAATDYVWSGGDGSAPDNTWYYSGYGSPSNPTPWVAMTEINNPNGLDLLNGEPNIQHDNGTTLLPVILRWTAPSAMLVDVSGWLWGAQPGQTTRMTQFDVTHRDSGGTLISTLVATKTYSAADGRALGLANNSFDVLGVNVSAGDRIDLVNLRSSGEGAISGVQFTINEIPEPATLSVLVLGTLASLVSRRRR